MIDVITGYQTDKLWTLVAISLSSTVLSLTLGNWLGAMTSYVLGWYAKWEWLDKYFKIKPETIERQRQRIDRYGIWLAAVYWAPIVGIVIMVALGLYKTRPRATALIALVGAFLRFLFWILLNAVWQQTTLFS